MTDRAGQPGQKKDRPRGVPARGPGVHRRAAKAAGGLVCEDCGIVQHGGKWYFGAPPLAELARGRCPACRRIRDKYPDRVFRLDIGKGTLADAISRLLAVAAKPGTEAPPRRSRSRRR